MEVKEEAVETSDDEIWIVRTADDEAEKQLNKLFVKDKENARTGHKKHPSCDKCREIFPSTEALDSHKCRKAMKRKPSTQDCPTICVPTKEDFIKRAQGRPRNVCPSENNDLLMVRPRKRRNKDGKLDSQMVTCNNCNESFTSKVRLKFHMQFHEETSLLTPEGKYKCFICEEFFECESTLFDHVHFQHHKHHRWMCPVQGCGKTFYLRATLTKHSRTHTDTRRYVCVSCGKRFLDKQTLDEHGVTHLQIKPYQCHICFKKLTRRSRLRMHLRAHEEALAPRLVYVCAVCSRAFRDATEAQDHASKSLECIEAFTNELKKETEEPAVRLSPTSGLVRQDVEVDDSPKLSEPVKRQVASPVAKPLLLELADESRCIIRVVEIEKAFRCEYCEDVFYLEEGLNNHRVIHMGVKNPFTCHICKVSFATYSRCTTHKTTHGFYKRPLQDSKKKTEGETESTSSGILGYGDFPVVKHFLCEDCGRSYLHWTYLQVHRRMKHPNENFLYKCNQCEMAFSNRWSVAYHRKKMHSKQDPDVPDAVVKIPRTDYRIPCRDCDKVLPNKTALYKHRKNEHSDMSLLMEESEEAQQDGATCLHCNITFSHIGELQKHLKSTTVRNHRMVNTGVRAWPCGRCPKRFRIKSDLRTHLRLKHPSHLVVVEIQSSNPSALDVMNVLSQNNIPHDRVLEINKMTFPKGVTSVIPSSVRALTMLNDVPKIPVAYAKPQVESSTGEWQTFRRGRAMATCSPRIGQIFQITPEQHQENGGSYSVNMDVNNEVLSTHQEISAQDFSTRPQLAAHQLFAVHHDLTLQPELAGQQTLAQQQELTVQQELAVNQEIPVRQELPVGQEILMRQEIPTHQELATNQELSDLNTHMLLHDRAVTNGNQMVQIQFDDTILLQEVLN